MSGAKSSSGRPRETPPDPRTSATRRRRGICVAGASLAVVIAAVVLAMVLRNGGAEPSPAEGTYRPLATGTYRLPVGAVSLVEGVPVRALIANAQAQLRRGQVTMPEKLPPAAPRFRSGGRPEIMFICAEYWPQCAAERWAMVMALSKFGTFTKLTGTTSSAMGPSPRTPTFSFYGATYLSNYLTLVTDELETNTDEGGGEYPLLQPPTVQEMNMINAWDRPPYTATKGSIPFVYIGGKFLLVTAQYDASAISHMSFQAAAHMMTAGIQTVSQHAEAAAGYLVTDFCALTHDQPAPVCSQVPSSLVGITISPTKN